MLQLPFCGSFAVFLTFDDNSRNWTSFLANSRNWQLARGCTVIEGTRLCDDGSGGGTCDYTIYFQSARIHIRSRPVVPGDYNLARTIKGSFYVSGKLPTYPSPKPTLTLSSYLGRNVGLVEVWVGSFTET